MYNNAFWFLSEALAKDKAVSSAALDEQDLEGLQKTKLRRTLPGLVPNYYTPTVTLSTKNLGTKVEIRVQDNGPGIPKSIIDKIFQPFFTTKPTGEGTVLGLSMAYDIIKSHFGNIKVNSTENEGTKFIIFLPI